jgi:hypothetical protein
MNEEKRKKKVTIDELLEVGSTDGGDSDDIPIQIPQA